ncbi:EMC6 family protein [Aspergillus candidus]|uniref:ER membrane protein complex subunit 6 n=1 Tax=Aspergillus candidus TaxID=41067 RepID=A0A2I2F6E5_ASPCN|nr:hypothetical protein BDW47DRAFT_127384 [Aspergillus candidus]PLB36220.1 hypothetical protein BDW47DRAFT_127384 [Aspergillus candidus]
MPPTKQELSLLINPLVPESVQHNNRTLSTLHSLTSFLLGLTAGILALQSATGFIFYLLGTVFVSACFHFILVSGSPAGAGGFFPGPNGGEIEGLDERGVIRGGGKAGVVTRKGAWRDVWFGGGVLGEALSGFVLGWAGVGGVLR